jgi:hypothetical protein
MAHLAQQLAGARAAGLCVRGLVVINPGNPTGVRACARVCVRVCACAARTAAPFVDAPLAHALLHPAGPSPTHQASA